MMMIKRKVVVLLTILLMIGGYAASIKCLETCGIKLRFNKSTSLPHKVFFGCKPEGNFTKGDYVMFVHPQVTLPVAKRVTGVATDVVSVDHGHVYINDDDCGALLKTSCSGREYTPIEEGKIPDGYVFVSGDHPKSFDSRYLEFGLVPENCIEEMLWPVL